MNNFELDVLAYLAKRPLKIVQSKSSGCGQGPNEQPKSYPVDKDAVFDEEGIFQLKLSNRFAILEELKKDA